MMLRLSDTIAAVATPPGEGGVGIVRVSGPEALRIAERLFRKQGRTTPYRSHTIHYGKVIHPATNETVDDALLLVFRAPRSYTGEDVVEFSCHGGPVTLARVLGLVLGAGVRHAEPGEFTQRAFLNGRMDLAQAEAVCDQIRAKTDAQQRLAIRQREGALSRRVNEIKDDLVGALAAVEVTIDFSDEVGDLDYAALTSRLRILENDLTRLIREGQQGRIYREGIRLAILGRPNAGKSSLLNAILGEERAIVTPVPGTTRDTIEDTANVRGIPVVAIDTAGLRETDDPVERIGVERAHAAIGSADLLLFIVDVEMGWTPDDRVIYDRVREKPIVGVLNKADRLESKVCSARLSAARESASIPWVVVSARTREGMVELEDAVAASVSGGDLQAESFLVTNARHLHALEQASGSIRLARHTAEQRLPPDFISIDLRGALDALGRITGETAPDEVIHRIFHDFCVGK